MSKDYSGGVFSFSRYVVLLGIGFFYGISAQTRGWPPVPQIAWVGNQVSAVVQPTWFILEADEVQPRDAAPTDHPLKGAEQPGLLALSFDVAPRQTNVRIIDRDGQVIHEWQPRWREIWPRGEGNFALRPVRDAPLHGLAVLPDGSFVANFEHFSSFRMDVCGEIVWKLDNYGHHSVSVAPDDTIWVPSEVPVEAGPTRYLGHLGPLRAYQLQQIAMDGTILKTIDLLDVFLNNDLAGYLYMKIPSNFFHWTTGDTLHLNDIEVVPADFPSALFAPGDLLVSLRNIHTLVLIDPDTERIKWTYTGGFVRQHDPDFMPSGRISIFDNRAHLATRSDPPARSRIVELDPETGARRTLIGDKSERAFFSKITGSHEQLENGNVLVVASQQGRLLEFTPDGDLVWRYDARQSKMKNGRAYNAQVLPPHMDKAFFETAKRRCEQ